MNTIAPDHYKTESGLQVWDVTRYMSGNMAQAFQYVYRAGRKGNEAEDLRKAVAFLEDWVAHPDVPRAVLPEGIEPTDGPSVGGCLLLDIPDGSQWKVQPLMQIISADSYEGEAMNGQPFCGRRLITNETLPRLKKRIAELGGVDG
ncbi:DUF3310 domain-containing protein [Acetobacter cerevisiae]|uniref:DUF3310 domain-containing protein n=1 Tax=Acetobacter cerevisiae TaxID=178900 RepID=A0A149UTW6_9PROT|nr:DUF3310 domain-containing protein [Acetobacter cerevisiae]KXV71392.1 hypothetical protein AD952_09200 [Acetobacter cerevisiae]MCP1246013.1 DUF3310 domain-containing protein [Acetobacter cerevisiae]MCP1255731.1 DUF3310 domain-containing protein [Acetobacter cerevisiae]